jgi:dTDP-4-dehydrorhamnose reductase
VRGYAKAVFSGLTTLACARLLEQLLLRAPDLHGLYHVASAPISKYALLTEIERRLSLGIEVVRDESVVCDRSLDGGRFAAATGIAVPQWNEMLDDLCATLSNGAPEWTVCKSPTTVSPTGTFS